MILRYAMPVPWESDGAAPLLHMARPREYRRGGGVEGRGRPLEKRGLIIISNRVPEHPRFTGLTHVRTPPRGHVREGFRVLRIETWGWNFNWNVELTGLNLRKKIWNAIRRLHGNILLGRYWILEMMLREVRNFVLRIVRGRRRRVSIELV